jgi:PAS domain-containing protein
MNDPVFPPYVDSLACEIILAFMEKEPEDRLGACGFDEVKGHPYFKGVDWDPSALSARDSPVVQNVNYEQNPTACSVNIKLQRKEAAVALAPSAAAPVAGSANPFQEFENVQLLESAPDLAKLTAIEDGGSDGDEAEGAAATMSPAELERQKSDLLRTEMSRVIDHEHHLEHVLDLMPGMISVKDAEEKFVVANKRFAATYGTVPQALAGKKLSDLGKHTEEADFMAEEDRVVRDTQMKVVKEFILHRSTGDADDMSNIRRGCKMKVTKIPYLDEVGGQCVLSIGEDVTDQDEHAKALRSRAEDAELRLMRLQQQHDLVRAPPATPPACRTDRLLLSHPARFCHVRVIC